MTILLGLAQVALILVLSPAYLSFIRNVHGRIQGRRGPNILQGYYDLAKLFRKDRIYSDRSSIITRITPAISVGVVGTAALLIPVFSTQVPFHFAGDFIFFIYLFAISRFLTALTGLDAGSTFGGMASSREMTLSSLAEPSILLGFVVISMSLQTMDISAMTAHLLDDPSQLLSPFFVLTSFSFFIVVLAENGRVPVDNPTTHLELTMIHEGMVLELSGRDLGLFQWAHATRLLVMVLVVLDIFLPFGIANELTPRAFAIALAVLPVKLAFTGILIAYVETANAKRRLFRVPDLLTLAFVFSLISLVSLYMTGVKHGN